MEKSNIRTALGQRLKDYGKWREQTNMDRFIILTFLTSQEKRDFCKKFLADADVDYFDGDEVENLTIKKSTSFKLPRIDFNASKIEFK